MNPFRLRTLRGAAFAAISLVSTAHAAADPAPDWTMFGANAAHNGRVPDTLGDGALQEVWRFGFPNSLNPLTVAGGALHATTTSSIVGQPAVWTLDSRLGVLRWNRDLGRNNQLSPASFGGGLLYLSRDPFGASQNLFTALDPATGATAWEVGDADSSSNNFTGPTFIPSGVLFNNLDYLINSQPSTGARIFRTQVVGASDLWTPTWDGTDLYSCIGGVLRAHNPANGAIRWTLQISPNLLNTSLVVAHDAGRIFIASARGLHVVNTTTRQVVWTNSTAAARTPAVADGVVYVIRTSGATIDARSVADGTLLRSFSTVSTATQVIVTSDALVAVSANSTLVFRRDGTGAPRSLPFGGVAAVQDDALFIGEAKGNPSRILCFRAASTDNLPPTAAAVTSGITEDLPAPVTLTGNDPEGAPLAAVIDSLPTKGTLFQTSDGVTPGPAITTVPAAVSHPGMTVIYQPPADGFGPAFDSFSFRTHDGRFFSPAAVASIDIAGASDSPVALPDQFRGLAGEWLHGFRPEANDYDVDGERPELLSFTRPRKGTLLRQPDGSLSYLPNELFFSGTDRFDYTVKDAAGLTGTATVTIAVGPPVSSDWPTFGNGPAHAGATDETFPQAELGERWATSLGIAPNQAAVAAGRIYLSPSNSGSANNWLTSLEEATGAELWRRDLTLGSPGNYVNPPTYHRGRVYMQRGKGTSSLAPADSRLWCFDAADGATVWSAPFGAQFERYLAPCPSDDAIHINGGTYGGLYGFNAAAGTQLFFDSSLPQVDRWTPSFANGELYTFVGTTFRAHDPQTGALRWSVEQDGTGANSNTIAIDAGLAFSMHAGGSPSVVSLTCIDLTARKVAWRVQRGFTHATTPAVTGGVVYGIAGSKIEALATANGLPIGTYVADEPLNSHLVVAGNRVFASGNNKTYVFNRDTRALLQTIPHGGLLSMANRTIFIAGSDGRMRAWAAPRPGNSAPSASPLTVSTNEDGPVTLNLSGSDPDGDALHFVISSLPDSGSLFQTVDGVTPGPRIERVPAAVPGPLPRLIYQPATDAQGPALGRFIYQVSDGDRFSPPAEVTIDVLPLNDPPVAVEDRFFLRPGEILSPLTVVANDLDPDGETLSIASFTQPSSGLVVRNSDGSLRYEAPPTGGEFSFTYTAADAVGESSSATVVLTVAADAGAHWPTFGNGPDHTGFAPLNHPTGPWALQWTNPLGVALNQAAVAGGLVFVTPSDSRFANNWCRALDAATGAQRWFHDMTGTGASNYVNPPSWFDGRLYIQQGKNLTGSSPNLRALTASSGAVAWQVPFDAQWERYYAPVVSPLGVFVNGGTYGGMYGFHRTTGVRRFFINRAQTDQWTPSIHRDKPYTFVEGVFANHNPDSGAVIWSLDLSWQAGGAMDRTVAFAGNLAFLVNRSPEFGVAQELVCIDLAARSVRWRVPGSYDGTPAVADGIVYAIRDTRTVVAHRAADGSPLGVCQTGLTGGSPSAQLQPLVTSDQLIFPVGASTYVFDRHTFSLQQTLPHFGPPSLADGRLVIAGSSGVVAAYARPPAVAFSPPGGVFPPGPLTVTLTAYDPAARIHFTTDGSAPQLSSPSLPSGGQVTLDSNTQLRAITVRGSKVSGIQQAGYSFAVPAPAAELAAGFAGPVDSDGDGRDDFDESLAGTNPADPGDFFRAAVSLDPAGTGVVMEWDSMSGRQYQIEASPNLGTWEPASAWLPATGGLMRETVPHPAEGSPARRFYRVVVAEATE